MKFTYINNNNSLNTLHISLQAGDLLLRFYNATISISLIQFSAEGDLEEIVIETAPCRECSIASPFVLFDFDQISRRKGDAKVIEVVKQKFSNARIIRLLDGLIDILKYKSDSLDLSIMGALINPETDTIIKKDSSIDDYLFPQYLSSYAQQMIKNYLSSGGQDWREIYRIVRKKYASEFARSLALFKRDYPTKTIYSMRDEHKIVVEHNNEFDFLDTAMRGNGYTQIQNSDNVWKGPNGHYYKLDIKECEAPADSEEENLYSNSGKRWTDKDIKSLISNFEFGKTISAIARLQHRTDIAVQAKLKDLGYLVWDPDQKQLVPINQVPSIIKYKAYIKNLNRAKIKGELAPHKLIFLLAVIDDVEMQTSHSLKRDSVKERLYIYFEISKQLEHFFNLEWARHVRSKVFNPTFTNPVIHMTSEPFYKLILLDGKTWTCSYSMQAINSSYKGFQLDKELVDLMVDSKARIELREYIEKFI